MSAVARVALTICTAVAAGAAAGYPDKPVQYIIPFAAAGESDVAARLQPPAEDTMAVEDDASRTHHDRRRRHVDRVGVDVEGPLESVEAADDLGDRVPFALVDGDLAGDLVTQLRDDRVVRRTIAGRGVGCAVVGTARRGISRVVDCTVVALAPRHAGGR